MGYERKLICTYYFIILEKKDFKESTPNMRTHLCAKGLVGTQGGMMFQKCFSISHMYNTKSDHFSPKIKPYIYGNRKSNAKS